MTDHSRYGESVCVRYDFGFENARNANVRVIFSCRMSTTNFTCTIFSTDTWSVFFLYLWFYNIKKYDFFKFAPDSVQTNWLMCFQVNFLNISFCMNLPSKGRGFRPLKTKSYFFYSLLPIYCHFLFKSWSKYYYFKKKNPRKKITNCHDNIHFNFHCFGATYRPSDSVYDRMYKVNRRRARAVRFRADL